MRHCLVYSGLVFAACTARSQELPDAGVLRAPQAPAVDVGIDLDWSMRRAGDELHIDYTVTNRLDRGIWVFDHLFDRPREAIVVHDAVGHATVAFTHGFVADGTGGLFVAAPPKPRMRRLEAESGIAGSAVVSIPLEAWLNYTIIKPLELGATHGVLEVAYCDGPRSRCINPDEIISAGGVTESREQSLLRGARLPLPDGAVSWIPLPPPIEWHRYDVFMKGAMRHVEERRQDAGL